MKKNVNEVKIENEFKKYKSRFIRMLGNHALNNTELDDVCKNLFGSKYKGSYPVDAKFPMRPGFFIFNTDIASGPGIHWMSVVLSKTVAYIYDSFGRDPEKTIPILMKRLRRANYKIRFDTKDAEQRGFYKDKMVVNCGHSSLSFLLCVHRYGIRAAMKI